MVKVAVIGGGIVGLSSAVAIQENFPSCEVTLFTEDVTPNTTGDGAAGLWLPYQLWNTPEHLLTRWAGLTYHYFKDLWKNEDAGEWGISLLPVVWVSEEHEPHVPSWASWVLGFSPMDKEKLRSISQEHKKSYSYGFSMITFTCECNKFLPKLMRDFVIHGGKHILKKIHHLEELSNDFNIIVNCSGLGAYQLINDTSMQPIRGQVMRVYAPWLKHVFLDESEHGNYIIPNQQDVVIGGTHQKGDWNQRVDQKDSKMIRDGTEKMIPGLKHAPKVAEWVGLRPGRPEVRLERDWCRNQGGPAAQVIHNYGHGGSGITLCRGCALDVVEQMKDVISGISARSRL